MSCVVRATPRCARSHLRCRRPVRDQRRRYQRRAARSRGARGWDLGPLRDVWLDTGSFDLLLRDPTEKSPPSLLQGDGVLLDGLTEGLRTLARHNGGAVKGGRPTTDLFVTTTLLVGETSRFTDAFGTQVQDVDHRGIFTFDEQDLASISQDPAIALAARSSASFPGAFEPSLIPNNAFGPSPGEDPSHPNMARFVNTTRPHYVADGGLMMNRPIKPLLNAIFDRQADRQVRRLLLYVVPSPGDAPDPRATPPLEQPYTFAGALLKDLGAALNQSISAELRALRDHNDSVEAMSDTRLRVAELGTSLGLDLLRPEALADYSRRESSALAGAIVSALMRALTTMPRDHMPPRWLDALAPGGSVESDCREAATSAVRAGWPTSVPEPGDLASITAFGRAPFDGAKATVLAMLRDGWALARARGSRRARRCDPIGARVAGTARTRQHRRARRQHGRHGHPELVGHAGRARARLGRRCRRHPTRSRGAAGGRVAEPRHRTPGCHGNAATPRDRGPGSRPRARRRASACRRGPRDVSRVLRRARPMQSRRDWLRRI